MSLTARLRRHVARLRRRLARIDERVVRLAPRDGAPDRGLALFSFILDPILEQQRTGRAREDLTHTHFWESLTMAELLCEAGYTVDAVSWENRSFRPEASYDLVIDVRTNLSRWTQQLERAAPDARKVAHLDTAHWSFNNRAELERLQALEERRGIELPARRQMPEHRLVELADEATYLGNEFTAQTYRAALDALGDRGGSLPMTRIPVTVPREYPWPQGRDFESARRSFVWFGSGGLVHKGLDVVLDAFARCPELELHVCGPVDRERDFAAAYRHELFELPNITTHGWVNVSSQQFLDLCSSSSAIIYPSCSEGGGSSALTCLHAGLAPIVTHQASVDLDPSTNGGNGGVELADARVETVVAAVQTWALQPADDVEQRCRAAWEWVRAHHTQEIFEERYREWVKAIG